MPEYTFICTECNDIFSVFVPMSDYMDRQICPKCNTDISVRRHYMSDLSSVLRSIRKSDDELKIGHLAQRNTEKMSADEREALTRKHNNYRYKEPEHELPKGMTRLNKNPKERKIPTVQRRVDPKGDRRRNKNAKQN